MEAGGRKNGIIPLQAKEGGQAIFLQKNVFDVVYEGEKIIFLWIHLSGQYLLDHMLFPDEAAFDEIVH